MRLVCTLYYLMPVKQVSVPNAVVVMMLLITSKAGAKPESSTVPIKKGKPLLDCIARSLSRQVVLCRPYFGGQREYSWGWACFFSIIHSLTVTTYLRQLGQLLSS